MPTSRASAAAAAAAPTATPNSELADLLATSASTTIYVDAEFNDQDAAALLSGTPPLHAEYDVVRGQWAVRHATDDEVFSAAAG